MAEKINTISDRKMADLQRRPAAAGLERSATQGGAVLMFEFPERGTAMQKAKWARDTLRGVIPDDELDQVTKRVYQLEKPARRRKK